MSTFLWLLLLFSVAAFIVSLFLLKKRNHHDLYEFRLASRRGKQIGGVAIAAFLGLVLSLAMLALEQIRGNLRHNMDVSINTVLRTSHESVRLWVSDQLFHVQQQARHPSVRAAVYDLLQTQAAGRSLTARAYSQTLLSRYLDDTRVSRQSQGFYVIGRNGITLASDDPSAIAQPNPLAELRPELLAEILSGQSRFIEPLRMQPPDAADVEESVLSLAVPIQNASGENIAVLVETLTPDGNFSKLLRLGRIGDSGESYAFNRQGYLISESRFRDQMVQMGLITPDQSSILQIRLVTPTDEPSVTVPYTRMAQSALQQTSGQDLDGYLDYRGVPVVGAWLWDKQLAIGIATEMDYAEAYRSYDAARQLTLLVLGITASVAIGFSLVLVRTSARSRDVLLTLSSELEQRVIERTNALARNERMLQRIIDTVPAPLYVKGTDGRYQLVNTEYQRVVGIGMEDAIGKTDRELLPADIAENLMAVDADVLRTGEQVMVEERVPRPDGPILTYQSFKTALLDTQDQVIGLVGVSLDITGRKQLESDLLEAKLHAEQGNRVKGEFLASMSHEIRTPLNAIVGMIALVQKEPLSALQQERLSIAQNSAHALLHIIDEVLDLSKLEANQLRIEYRAFNVAELIRETVNVLAYQAQEKGLELEIDLEGLDHPWLCSDPARLRQILLNLLGNALKFTESGKITVTAWIKNVEAAQFLVCRITDTGIGIDPAAIRTLFDPFTQADASTTRRYGGTGLGLAICRRLCELMDGEIRVKSQPGQGSQFEFSVQVAVVTVPRQAIDQCSLQGGDVLVAEANESHRLLITAQLESLGVRVIEADSAEAVMRHLAQPDAPDYLCALLDARMGGADSFDLVQQIRQQPRWRELPLLMLTSSEPDRTDDELLSAGLQGCLRTPLHPRDLETALKVLASQVRPDDVLLSESYLHTLMNAEPEQVTVLPKSPITRTRLTVLLVEDNDINRLIVTSLLESSDIDCLCAQNGQQAIQFLQEGADSGVEVILMDCQMPVVDGYEATRRIRAGDAGDWAVDLPIIALTAHAMPGDKEKCLACGMSDFVTKPIEEHELHKILQRHTGFNRSEQRDPDNQMHWPTSLQLINPVQPPAFAEHKLAYLSALRIHVNDQQKVSERLQVALANGDWSSIADQAHSLKSSAANLGFMPLHALAHDVEQQIRQNGADAPPKVMQMRDLIAQSVRDSRAILALNPPEDSGSEQDWPPLLEQIRQLLENHELVPVDLIYQFRVASTTHPAPEEVNRFIAQLTNFDYESALGTIDDIALSQPME